MVWIPLYCSVTGSKMLHIERVTSGARCSEMDAKGGTVSGKSVEPCLHGHILYFRIKYKFTKFSPGLALVTTKGMLPMSASLDLLKPTLDVFVYTCNLPYQ